MDIRPGRRRLVYWLKPFVFTLTNKNGNRHGWPVTIPTHFEWMLQLIKQLAVLARLGGHFQKIRTLVQ